MTAADGTVYWLEYRAPTGQDAWLGTAQNRFALDAGLLALLRENGLLYDRIGSGELLHAYTPVLPTGFYVEVLERRGGYDGYGVAPQR